MSDDFAKAVRHDIWPVEKIGDLLVVTPGGDLVGFQSHNFQSEYNRVLRLAGAPEFRNVLMDLGSARYFGSEMIGALVNLRTAVADQAEASAKEDAEYGRPPATTGEAGVLGLCNVSDDMEAGFDVMNVSKLWRTYDSRKAAIADLATVKAGEKLRHWLRPLAFVLGLLLLVGIGLLIFVPEYRENVFPPSAAGDLERLESVDRRWTRALNAKTSREELERDALRLHEENRWWKRRVNGRWKDYDWGMEHFEVITAGAKLNEWLKNPIDASRREAYQKALVKARRGVAD